MDKYTYTLNRNVSRQETKQYYNQAELEWMTTYQLREICRKEKIINGIRSPLDKDELIRQIMRFRGRKEDLFIGTASDEGITRLETLFNSAKIHYIFETIKGCAKLTVYEGISVEYFDQFTIGYHEAIVDTNALLVSGNKICAVFRCEHIKTIKKGSILPRQQSFDVRNLWCAVIPCIV